jgi:hypothetical protein
LQQQLSSIRRLSRENKKLKAPFPRDEDVNPVSLNVGVKCTVEVAWRRLSYDDRFSKLDKRCILKFGEKKAIGFVVI